MRLTRAGEYAVRCVLYLSLLESDTVTNRKEIAKAMEIPDQFLGKIAKQLSHAGILEVVQGAHGGIRLARSPSDITLLEVIEAIIGEIFLNDCVLRSESCNRSSTCSVHRVWEKARRRASGHVERIHLRPAGSGRNLLFTFIDTIRRPTGFSGSAKSFRRLKGGNSWMY